MAEEKKSEQLSKPQEKTIDKKKKPSAFKKLGTFFKEMRSEIKKVVWPSPKQIVNNTVVVIVVIVLSGTFIGLIDTLFKFVAGFLTK